MRRLRIAALVVALAAMGLGACSSSGGNSRTIQVDYHSDDFAGSFLGFFPRTVTVKPGMTLKFHQTWTGEPHSVTLGRLLDDNVKPIRSLINDIIAGKKEVPEEDPPEYHKDFWENQMPSLFTEGDALNQAAAKPCFVKTQAELPLDHKACAKAAQVQPAFNGKYAYYSSGFIPFEGARGNTFQVKLANDVPDGKYFFYCNVHFILMSGDITVKRGAKVESQAALNRRGKAEADRLARPLKKEYDKELAGKGQYKGNLAGSGNEATQNVMGIINEFTPRTINTKVGEKVTWTFTGNHTISFNVPPYTPLFVFNKKGELGVNQGLDKPKGGWPGAPEGHSDFENEAPPAIHLDAGEFDGSGGLKSSGVNFNAGDTYAVTFTKAGTYPYACLIHPGMIGKVVVS
jgi:plastocyanin